MNKRIQELAEQAGFPDWWINPPESERNHGESKLMLEKFTELIVEECSSIISVTTSGQLFTDKAYNRGYFDGRSDAASMIIDIFGVEE